MLKQELPEIAAAVEAIIAVAVEVGRGGILTHRDIKTAMGDENWRKRRGYIIRKALTKPTNRLLTEHHITARSVPGVGYKLLEAEEQVIVPMMDRSRRISNQASHAIKEIGAIGRQMISPSAHKAQSMHLDALRERKQQASRDARTAKALFGAREHNPRTT